MAFAFFSFSSAIAKDTDPAKIPYLWQAAKGQANIYRDRITLGEALRDPEVSEWKKSVLREVPAIKKYATEQGLRPTDNYGFYVKLKNPWITTLVSACSATDFESVSWSFPITGNVPYLGYFDKTDAEKFAQKLEALALDVYVRPVRAFSTLGYFNDPIFSSMLDEETKDTSDVIETIFHESVHATLFWEGKAAWNEAMAQFIAEKLTYDYLSVKDAESAKKYRRDLEATGPRIQKAGELYGELKKIYDRGKLAEGDPGFLNKQQILEKKAELGRLRNGGVSINNARLIQYKMYVPGEKIFEPLYERCERKLPCFLEKLKQVDAKNLPEMPAVGVLR